jgi:hypothetical protein
MIEKRQQLLSQARVQPLGFRFDVAAVIVDATAHRSDCLLVPDVLPPDAVRVSRGSLSEPRSLSALSSVCFADQLAAARAPPPESAGSCAMPPAQLGSAADSRLTSCATRTPWRCPVKGWPGSLSKGSSGTPISRSHPPTCAGSTTPRSSTPSTNDPPQ